MKTRNYLLLIIVFTAAICTSAYAQDSYVIKYDFSTGKKTLPPNISKIKPGDFYQIEVENINLNLYQVNLGVTDTSTDKALDLTKLASGFGPVSTLIDNIITSRTSVSFNSLVASNPAAIGNLQNNLATIKASTTESITSAPPIITSPLIEQILILMSESVESKSKSIKGTESAIDLFLATTKLDIKKSFYLAAPQPVVVDVNYISSFELKYKTLQSKYSIQEIELKKKYDELLKFHRDNQIFIPPTDTARVNQLMEKVKELNKKVTDNISKLKGKFTDKAMVEISSSMYDGIDNVNRKYHSVESQLLNDQATIVLNIVPRDSASNLNQFHPVLKFPTYKKLYFGIGSGGYVSGLKDSTYSIRGTAFTDSTNSYSLVEENSSKIELGFNAMLKAGYSINQYFGIHVTGGAGFSFSNPIRARFMVGAGISVGRKHRITLDGGFIGGHVNSLSNAYDLETTYKELPESVVVSTMKESSFLSLGYIFIL